MSLPVLTDLVQNMMERCHEMGLLIKPDVPPRPLVNLLAELLGSEVGIYHEMIQAWYDLHLSLHPSGLNYR